MSGSPILGPPVPQSNGAPTGPVDPRHQGAIMEAAAQGGGHVDYEQAEIGDEDDISGLGDKRTKRGFSKRVTLGDLERYFEYPIEEVSKMMGVSTTIIKRLCRKYGIKRWPYRQVRPPLVWCCAPACHRYVWVSSGSGGYFCISGHIFNRMDQRVTFHIHCFPLLSSVKPKIGT